VSAGDIYFTVTYSGRVVDSLRLAADRVEVAGRLSEVRDAVRLLHSWLRADPETLGDPYRVHRGRELTEYIGFVGPLVVRYNIHHATRHVFVVHPVTAARWAGF
jgi:hypothetical protein